MQEVGKRVKYCHSRRTNRNVAAHRKFIIVRKTSSFSTNLHYYYLQEKSFARCIPYPETASDYHVGGREKVRQERVQLKVDEVHRENFVLWLKLLCELWKLAHKVYGGCSCTAKQIPHSHPNADTPFRAAKQVQEIILFLLRLGSTSMRQNSKHGLSRMRIMKICFLLSLQIALSLNLSAYSLYPT